MNVKSRDQAISDGDKHYYTGAPCAKGHDVPRHSKTGACLQCHRLSSARNQAKYAAKAKARDLGMELVTIAVPGDQVAQVRALVDMLLEANKKPAQFQIERTRAGLEQKVYDDKGMGVSPPPPPTLDQIRN